MNLSEHESVWKMMSKRTFEINSKSFPTNLACGLCEKLMIDACQSACGCPYCHKCISDYIGGGHKYCPGGKEDCQYVCLELDKTVFRNQVLNIKIMKVKVRCLNESCECDIELAEMGDHLRVCLKQQIKCPYAQIFCESEEASKDKILSHLGSDTFRHSELLIELIHNLRDELNDVSKVSKLEISTLREESRMKDTKIGEIISQMEEQRREMEGVKEELREVKREMEGVKEELREVKKEMELRLSMVKTEAEERETRMEAQRWSIDEVRREMREERENNLKNVREMSLVSDKRVNNLVTFFPNIDADFVWRVCECSKMKTKFVEIIIKINEEYKKYEKEKHDKDESLKKLIKEGPFSDSFYSKDYKLCLLLNESDDDGDIVLGCLSLRGDNDDRVEWPMRLSVTFGILNQDTLRTHASVTVHYDSYEYDKGAFERPTDIFNPIPIVGVFPMKYSSILDNQSVVLEDSVIVSCVLRNKED